MHGNLATVADKRMADNEVINEGYHDSFGVLRKNLLENQRKTKTHAR